jgi:hypothetical protein
MNPTIYFKFYLLKFKIYNKLKRIIIFIEFTTFYIKKINSYGKKKYD